LSYLLVAELICGVVALLLLAVAFTELSWGEGGSQDSMKRASIARAKRLFWWSGLFWLLAIGFYLLMR
jgi:hypothetical protein